MAARIRPRLRLLVIGLGFLACAAAAGFALGGPLGGSPPPQAVARRIVFQDVSVEVPAGWYAVARDGQFPAEYLSTFPLDSVCRTNRADCPTAFDVPPGHALVRVSRNNCRCTTFDLIGDPTWNLEIAGMPARESIQRPPPAPDRSVITWSVIVPGMTNAVVSVAAVIPTFDPARLTAVSADVARTLQFTRRPPTLPTGAAALRILGPSVERIVEEHRTEALKVFGSDYYSCFPVAPGSRDGVVHGGPTGPLDREVAVTCSVDVAPVDALGLWRVVLTAREKGADPSSSFSEAIYLDSAGLDAGWQNLTAGEAGIR